MLLLAVLEGLQILQGCLQPEPGFSDLRQLRLMSGHPGQQALEGAPGGKSLIFKP